MRATVEVCNQLGQKLYLRDGSGDSVVHAGEKFHVPDPTVQVPTTTLNCDPPQLFVSTAKKVGLRG